ncbi:MAG: Vgb family protein [Methanobacteriota archaeon]
MRLDPHTNAWTLIEGGPNYRGVARGLTFDGRGRAWYRLEGAPPGPGHLVRYDPAAGTSELWSLPVLFGAPGALCVDARGHVWATFTTARGRGHGIGHLDPVARTFDEFRVASGQESYHGLATDPAGTSVWFTYEIFQSGVRPQNLTVFRLDLATRRCHGFPLRSLSTIGRQPRRLEVDARGDGWFVDESHFVGKISKTQVCARHPLDWKTTKVGHTKTRPNVTEEQGAPPVVRSATIYNPPVLLWDTACSTDFFVPGVVPHGLALYGGSAWFADGPLNNRRAIFRLTP